jgi:hypothetical protein
VLGLLLAADRQHAVGDFDLHQGNYLHRRDCEQPKLRAPPRPR